MILSALGLSLVGLLGKIALGEATLVGVVFFRFSSALILIFLLFALLKKIKINWKTLPLKLNLYRCLLVLGAQGCFYYYIQHQNLMNGTALLNTGPLFIPLIERVFLGRKIGKSTWISLLVSFIGVLLILQPDGAVVGLSGIIGLSAGLFQGGSQVIFGVYAKGEDADMSVLILFAMASVISFFPVLFGAPFFLTGLKAGHFLFLSLGLGLASIINMLARAKAYSFSTPSRLASFLYFSVVLAGMYDWLFFDAAPNLLSSIGAFLVILGGILKIYLRRKVLKL